nr:hypothetical protein [Tanacetum cinerariifolium]
MTQLTSMCEMACQIIQKNQEENRIEKEQVSKAQNSKIPICCDDDDDYDSAITTNEPVDSLSMGDEYLDTIPATESDEFIKSDVENLVPNPNIRLFERLLYNNSSPRPPKEFVFENSDAAIESFSPSHIPVEDSDSRMEEIDSSFNPDDPMPPGIEEDDDDSERDILIHEELLDNYSLSLPVNENPFFLSCFVVVSVVQYSRKFKDSCQSILSSKSLFSQLQLEIILLHLAGSQPMLKSSYKSEDGVIISIPPLVGGVADVMVEKKGT